MIRSFKWDHQLFEPCHEIMVFSTLRKLILQTCMHSHPVGLNVWFLVGPFVNIHTSCMRTAKVLARLQMRCDKYHNLMSWLILFLWNKIKISKINMKWKWHCNRSIFFLLASMNLKLVKQCHQLTEDINFIFLRFIKVWMQWITCKVSDSWRSHAKWLLKGITDFTCDLFHSYFDEPQKNEIHLLYLHFVFTSFLLIICEMLI